MNLDFTGSTLFLVLLLFAVAMLVIPAILEKRSKQKSAEPNA